MNRHLHGRARAHLRLDPKRAFLPEGTPRHVEQIGDAEIFERLKCQGAGVQKGGETKDRRRHMRHDAERATERGDHAGARPARKAGRQGVENAGPRRHDDDERCQKEIETHAPALPRES